MFFFSCFLVHSDDGNAETHDIYHDGVFFFFSFHVFDLASAWRAMIPKYPFFTLFDARCGAFSTPQKKPSTGNAFITNGLVRFSRLAYDWIVIDHKNGGHDYDQ